LKKILVLIILGFILSGCATYKFQKSATSGSGGYLACYDGKPIIEYTVGKEKSLPDLILAKERFKRRRSTVEYYYKKMDQMESRLKNYFWDTPVMLVDLLGGVLRWPFVAVADYKYNHNSKYKERVDRLDEEKDALEKSRQDSLKVKLDAYILKDLEQETLLLEKVVIIPAESKSSEEIVSVKNEALPVATVIKEEPVSQLQQTASTIPLVQEAKPPVIVEPLKEIKPVVKSVLTLPVAVIIAQPAKGNSPLKVNFSGQKSYSQSGKIVAYDWDFGDGDTSTKKNPENTYWSTTFGSRNFTVTLTIRDDAGNTSIASTIIEVITK
jgi:hypothetical protein